MARRMHSAPLILRRRGEGVHSRAHTYRQSAATGMKHSVEAFERMKRHLSYRLLIVVMVATLSLVVVPYFFGCRFESIRSGSMSPALDTGDLTITLPVNPYSIEIGDIIAYHPPSDPDALVIHRVVGISQNGPLAFLTKGDANPSLDAYSLPAKAVVGEVRLHLPWIGYLVGFAGSTTGFVLLLVIPGAIIIYAELNKLWNMLGPKRRAQPKREALTLPSSPRGHLSARVVRAKL